MESAKYVRRGHVGPRWTVDARVEGGMVEYHPAGGGPLRRATEGSFLERFRPATDGDLSPGLARVRVCLDEMTEGDAWTFGHLWNGFVMPLFELGEIERMLDELARYGDEVLEDEELKLRWWRDGDALVVYDGSDPGGPPDRYEGVVHRTPEGPRRLYGVGAGSWTWMEAGEDEDEDAEG